MKIVQLIYSLSSGGAERFVVNLSNELFRLGHDVTIVQLLADTNGKLSFNKQFINSGIEYVCLGFNHGISLLKIIEVDNVIKSLSPDVVHCHLNVIPYIFPLAITLRRIKFFHTIHNVAEKASGPSYQKLINRWFYRTKRIIPITISSECRNSLLEFYNLNSSIAKIDNGCISVSPSEKFDNVVNEVNNIRENRSIPIFVHVARCHSQKNQTMLIDVFNELNVMGINFRLLVIGADYDSALGLELQRKACNKIYFLGLKSNVGDYLLYSDYFVLTSYYEGLPISLIEAMSAGCTPICTSVGGIPDVITSGINGYLSTNVTTDSFVNIIKYALQFPIDKNLIQQTFINRFSINKCAKEYIELFENNEKK